MTDSRARAGVSPSDVTETAPPRWFAQALAHQPEIATVTVAGCEIACRHWGDPRLPCVILVHGNGAHARWWDHVAPLLSADHSVVAMDLSGHGDSGWRAAYSWSAWAQEIRTAAATASSPSQKPPIVIAHSMGGRAAMLAACDEPSFAGLIAVDTSIAGTVRPGVVLRIESETVPPQRFYDTEAQALARFRLGGAPVSNPLPYVLDHVAKTSLRHTDAGYTWKRDASALRRTDMGPAADTIARISCPLVLIRAEHGKLLETVGDWYSAVTGQYVPVVDIPLAGHHIMLDEPLMLVAALRALLADWGATGVGSGSERRWW